MELHQRIAALSPIKKRLFEFRLQQERDASSPLPVGARTPKSRNDGSDENGQLVAYLAPRADYAADPERLIADVRRSLQDKLPAPMQPAVYLVLERLPLTPNGKVDRRALPALRAAGSAAPMSETDAKAPRTELERVLAEVWRETLGVAELGIHDNFFALGGDSIKGIVLINRIQERLGKQVQVVALLQSPTIAALAASLSQQYQDLLNAPSLLPTAAPVAARVGELRQIQAVMRHPEMAFPLSSAQRRLWFLNQLEPDSSVYNVSAAFRLRGQFDPQALRLSLQALARRHEILRTVFVEVDGLPLQRVLPELELDVQTLDLRALPEAEREQLARQEAAREIARPFDLARGPLLRLRIWQLDEEERIALLCLHHIISDGWSVEVLMRELSALYEAEVTGRSAALPELTIQYADYALWQRQRLASGELAEQLAYWQKQLGGELPDLDLPPDRPRPSQPTYNGAQCKHTLDAQLAKKLSDVARQAQTTNFTVYLTAFGCLLQRYSGQEQIVLGCPLADRQTPQTEPLIGLFVNPLALRIDLRGACTFAEALSRVRQVVQEARAHQDVPFEKLVEEFQVARRTDRQPIFQAMFVLHADPAPGFQLAGVRVTPLETLQHTAKFELTLSVLEAESGTTAMLEYNTDLFEAATAERMLAHYRNLLLAVAADPQTELAVLPLLSAEEQQQLLRDWNATETGFARSGYVPDLIAQIAAQTPQQLAVADGSAQLSYAELNTRANQLAHLLQGLGVGPEMCVGVCLERSADWIVSLLAVLKAGGAYLPLDPAYPAERIQFLAADANAAVVITHSTLAHWFTGADAKLVQLDADCAKIAQRSIENPPHRLAAENLAYVIYTSGSTGQPKGVEISQSALRNLLGWHQQTYGISATDRASQLAGIGFDAAVWEIWPYLTIGASIHLPAEDVRLDPVRLRDWIVTQGITSCFAPTPLAESLLALPWPDNTLRRLLTGGDRLRSYAPSGVTFQLVNHYGPTENAVVATAGIIGQQPDDVIRPPALGKPIANNQIYVLDRQLRPVPQGVIGELYIGGRSLARGYRGRADSTAERFSPNPFGGSSTVSAGTRLYRTGDLVRYRADGALEFVGRADQQVKIRGHRIELAEIEQALLAHPAVRECAVVLPHTTAGEARLNAFWVAQTPANASLDALTLRRFLRDKLPDFMLPADFRRLDALPLTSHGKLDRRALSAIISTSGHHAGQSGPPRNPVEAIIAHIWEEVLRVESVGAGDDFFALGGHSLLATQIVSRLRDAFGVELPLRELFLSPTVAGVAEKVAALRQGELSAPPLSAQPRPGEFPLSFAQQRLWFVQRLAPNSSSNNIATAVRIKGALDTAAMEQSLREIIRRHEVLRTVFPEREGQPQQLILPISSVTCRLPVVDLQELAETQREAEARRRAVQEAQQPFDLAVGPLLRTTLLRLDEREHVLLLSMHHIISDGWSFGILIRELTALYRAYTKQLPSPLPELPLQYADFAAWQRRWLQAEALERQLAYWRKQLQGVPVLELPTDRPRPPIQRFNGATYSFLVEPETLTALQSLSRRESVTLFIVLLAAFKTLLHQKTQQDDIVLGADIANRNRTETEGLIGFFVNMLVLRTNLAGDPDFGTLLRRVREVALDAYAHQDAPFEKLVEALHAPRDLSRNPLFQIAFVLQNTPTAEAAIPELELIPLEVDSGTVPFDLVLSLREEPAGLCGMLSYSTDLFDSATIAQMAQQFQTLLRRIAANPEERLSQLLRDTSAAATENRGRAPERFARVRLDAQTLAQVAAEINERAVNAPQGAGD